MYGRTTLTFLLRIPYLLKVVQRGLEHQRGGTSLLHHKFYILYVVYKCYGYIVYKIYG